MAGEDIKEDIKNDIKADKKTLRTGLKETFGSRALLGIILSALLMLLADVYMYTSVRNVMIEQEKETEKDELSMIADSVNESIAVI